MKNYEGTRIPRKKKKLAKKIQERRTGQKRSKIVLVTIGKDLFMQSNW